MTKLASNASGITNIPFHVLAAHMQVNEQDRKRQVCNQDDFEDGLACIQAEEKNKRVKQQQWSKTLKTSYLYLDSM